MTPRFPSILAFVVGALLLAGAAEQAAAQVRVDISFKRKLYVMYEPLIATVTINNLSGRPLLLENSDHHRWFGFNIETADGRIVPPINPDYALAPAAVGPGEKLTRSVNLTPLFPLHDFGLYRVKATVYVSSFGRYFSSPPLAVEITDGRPIWQEVVGLPGGEGKPELRTITLLAHKLSRSTRLYVRIEDRERGRVYATHQLGQFLTFGRPEVMLDVDNQIHILQNTLPKQFLYTHLGLGGEVLGQQAYREAGSRPTLAKKEGGTVGVKGGKPFTPGEEEVPTEGATDKLGDRPVPLPGS
jgi:hypothetical protein